MFLLLQSFSGLRQQLFGRRVRSVTGRGDVSRGGLVVNDLLAGLRRFRALQWKCLLDYDVRSLFLVPRQAVDPIVDQAPDALQELDP